MPISHPSRRRTRGRGRIGCLNCRNRRIKCDEKNPCGFCNRRGLECTQPDSILPQGWSASTTSAGDHDPATTFDVFQHIYSTRSNRTTHHPTQDVENIEIVTSQMAKLFQSYQEGVGTWLDILDRSLTFQRRVLSCALSSPLLLHSLCALSAKQMSLTREKDVWEPISVQHYGQSLRLLTDELWAEGANRDIILTATILLCSHDVLAFPDADYQRLLYGGRTLIEADFDAIDTSDLSRASFWIYARQDVSLALENERPTLIPPKEWPPVPSPEETQEDALARRMLWLLARVIEVRFDGRSDADGKEQDELIFDLTSELFDWSMSIPGHANGVEVEDDLDLADDLEQTWFCVPSSAAGYLYSHLADILRLEFWRSRPTSPISDDLLDAALSGHALKIASICLSPGVSDGVLTVAVDPLFYAAKHCESLSLKARIWALLEDIERRLGIHTRNKVSRLQSQWVSTAEAAA